MSFLTLAGIQVLRPLLCRGEHEQFAEYMKTAVTVDWDVINENRPAWNVRWNRIIER